MLPISEHNPYPPRYEAVTALILLNAGVFAAQCLLVGFDRARLGVFFVKWGFLPGYASAYRWFTSLFIHADIFHIAGNMWVLWLFGPKVEGRLGARFLPFYVISGFGSSFLDLATRLGSLNPAIGASGAIAGVVGAYAVLFPTAKIGVLQDEIGYREVSGKTFALLFVLEQTLLFAYDPISEVAYAAHLGGILLGALVAKLFFSASDLAPIAEASSEPPGPPPYALVCCADLSDPEVVRTLARVTGSDIEGLEERLSRKEGVIGRRLSWERASEVRHALESEGVAMWLVSDAELPEPPPLETAVELSPSTAGLAVRPEGAGAETIPWRDCLLIVGAAVEVETMYAPIIEAVAGAPSRRFRWRCGSAEQQLEALREFARFAEPVRMNAGVRAAIDGPLPRPCVFRELESLEAYVTWEYRIARAARKG